MRNLPDAPAVLAVVPPPTELARDRRAARVGIVLGSGLTLIAGGLAFVGTPSVARFVAAGSAIVGACLVAASVVVERQARALGALRDALGPFLASVERDRHLASLGEVSAVLAHEIRNPIAAVKGHAQLLVELAEPGTKLRSKAERIESEVVRLERLTDDLLTFARSGRLRTRDVDLRPLLTQAASVVSRDVEVEVPDAPLVASIDAGRFLQVVENLLRNAMRHGRPPVRVSARATSDGLRVEVRDHGAGIPPERLPHVFEPFVTDATRGTGLGLAVVRRVVDMHGGTVEASNHPEGGALFVVFLPRPSV